MKKIDKLTVRFHKTEVGTLFLTPDNKLCAFEYSKKWLAEGLAYPLWSYRSSKDCLLRNHNLFMVTFARKDNSLRINRLVGLFENLVTRWQPFVFLSSSSLCSNVITLMVQR